PSLRWGRRRTSASLEPESAGTGFGGRCCRNWHETDVRLSTISSWRNEGVTGNSKRSHSGCEVGRSSINQLLPCAKSFARKLSHLSDMAGPRTIWRGQEARSHETRRRSHERCRC